MLARFLLVHNIGMATLAGLVPGKGHSASCYLANGVATIMPVLPKAVGTTAVRRITKAASAIAITTASRTRCSMSLNKFAFRAMRFQSHLS